MILIADRQYKSTILMIVNFKAKHILILSFLFITQQYAFGCDCLMYPVDYHVQHAKNIIIAKVVSITQVGNADDDLSEVIVAVSKVYKGETKTTERLTFIRQDNCDPDFTVNEEFLLFFHKEGEKYHSDHCSYSDKVSNAGPVIKRIKKALKNHS